MVRETSNSQKKRKGWCTEQGNGRRERCLQKQANNLRWEGNNGNQNRNFFPPCVCAYIQTYPFHLKKANPLLPFPNSGEKMMSCKPRHLSSTALKSCLAEGCGFMAQILPLLLWRSNNFLWFGKGTSTLVIKTTHCPNHLLYMAIMDCH